MSSIVLLSSLFVGFFGNSRTAYAVGCEELGGFTIGGSRYLTPTLSGGAYIISNKDPNKAIGLDEPFTLYFEGKAQNGTGTPPDPNWSDCGDFSAQKYVVGFYIYQAGSKLGTQQGGATVKPQFKALSDGVSVKAGFSTTLKQLWDAADIKTMDAFDIYAYLCPNYDCELVSGIDSFGKVTLKSSKQDGDLNTGTINEGAGGPIDQSALSTPTYIDASLGASERTSATGTLLNWLASFIGTIIQLLTTLIYWLFAFVVAPLIEAVLSIHPYQDVFVQVIYPGWLILRNLSNILFIVVLLIIGLATLFQVEKYNYKHLLVKVLIAAVMVNFSLVIGQSVLGIADTVQNQFLPDRGNVVRALGFELMVRPIQNMQLNDGSTSGGFSNLTYPFFLFALALGAFFSFVAILVFLVVRIVGLWVLLMVSPVAYVARILPSTEKYAEMWWNKFLAYAFITPIFAFFLNIAALFANSHVLSQGSTLYDASAFSSGVANFVYLTASHITTLVFLMAGLTFAGSTGVVGAKAMTDFVKKGMSKPFTWSAKKLGEYANEKRFNAANKFEPNENDGRFKSLGKSALSSIIAPDARVKARAARIKERQELAAGQAGANAADFSKRGLFGQVKTTKGIDFRMRDLKKKGEEALFNPKNGAEVGLKANKDLVNHKYDDAWGKLVNGFNEGNVEDILKRISMPPGAAGQQKLLETFKAAGMKDNELLALDEAMKSGRKKDLAGSGYNVTEYDSAGKFKITSPAEAEKKERDAAAKVGAAEYARNATKDSIIDKDGVMKPYLAAQLLNSYNNKDGKVDNGIADERARMQMKPIAKEAIVEALQTTNRELLDRNIDELTKQARHQLKLDPDDARRLAEHIIVTGAGVFNAGSNIDISKATGSVGATNNITNNTTNNNANTTNNDITNNIRTKIENNVDVNSHLQRHAPTSTAAFSQDQKEFIEKAIKRATRRAIGQRLQAGGTVTSAYLSQAIKNSIDQEIGQAKPADKVAYNNFNVEMSNSGGYNDLASEMYQEVSPELNQP
jgi:hypothetical protein